MTLDKQTNITRSCTNYTDKGTFINPRHGMNWCGSAKMRYILFSAENATINWRVPPLPYQHQAEIYAKTQNRD